jgi:type I restriction enzyme S subunit
MSKTSWPVKTLGDVCEVIAGQSPEGKFYNKEGKGVPFYQGKKDFAERVLGSPTTWTSEVTKLARPGDILMSVRAPVGPVNLCPIEACIGRGLAAIRPSSKTDTDFIYYYLESIQSEIAGTEGAVFASINKAQIAGLSCPVPPLEEQKRIVALLDAATARVTELTACYEQARTHANNLFTSALRDALESNPDLPVKTLGEVCSIDSVLVDPKDLKYSHMSHIGAGNIEAQTGRLFDIKTASEDNLISGKYLFTTNDVLYSKIRPYLVKVATPETAGLCSADVYPLRPGPLLTRMFLFYSLISETFTEYAIGGSSRTGMPKVNREHLFKYELRIPPTAVQLEIVSRLEAVRVKTSEMVAAYVAKLTAAKNLRQSILEAAFAGEL